MTGTPLNPNSRIDAGEAQEKIDQLADDNRRKQRELDRQRAELSAKIQEIDRIHSSTSWKITAPVRKIGPVARKYLTSARSLKSNTREFLWHNEAYLFLYRAVGFIVRRAAPRHIHKVTSRTTHEILGIKKWYSRNKKAVTVVIPSYNDQPLLAKCLESIEKTTRGAAISVVIVDDASPDPAHRDYLGSIDRKNVSVIYRQENGGFARAVNDGLRAAATGDVIILNSDTSAKKLWLESLQYAAYSQDRIGIVGPKLLYPDGRVQHAGLHRNPGSPDWFDHYYRFQPSWFGPANVANFVIGTTGACMYVKRQVIDKIGYLDEKYPMEFEDLDYCLRAWDAGFASYYFPAAVLTHHESASRSSEKGAREKESQRYFWEKWGDWFDKRNVRDAQGRLRVIYILQSTAVGGGHRLVFEHVNRLKKAGVAVELYALEGQPQWFPLDIEVTTFADYPQLIAALEPQEAIKVATWWQTAEPVWLASVSKGIPVYYVQDIETSYYRDDPDMQQVVLSRYRQEFNYITESHWNQRQLAAMGLTSAMIGCGIDTEVFKPSGESREKNVLLSLGRSHYLKNLAMTMDAWRGITQSQPTLWMFGVEPHLAAGLANAEYFVSPPDREVNSLYNRATVFVQSSVHEGFCLPVLEAMAAGAPVICTDAHGNADFCEDGKNCLMVEQNDVEGLRAAIIRLIANPELQARLRQEGYATASAYSWPLVMQEVEEFYRGISSPDAGLSASPENVLAEARD